MLGVDGAGRVMFACSRSGCEGAADMKGRTLATPGSAPTSANFEDSPATTTCTCVGQRSTPAPTSRVSVDQIEPRIKVSSSTFCSERNNNNSTPTCPPPCRRGRPEHSASPLLGVETLMAPSLGILRKACRVHTQVQARHETALFA